MGVKRSYYQRNKARLLKNQRTYRARHQAKVLEKQRVYRAKHRREQLAYSRAYNAKHRKHRNQLQQDWRGSHKNHVTQQNRRWCVENRERINILKKKWRERNKEKCAIENRLSVRKRQVKAVGKVTYSQISKLYEKQHSLCASCGRSIQKRRFHIDHKMPFALGGKHHIKNVQLLCPTCNLRKGAKHPKVWAAITSRRVAQ